MEYVAKRHNVVYVSSDAHRADYDANVLAQVWLKMISRLTLEKEITTSLELLNTDTYSWAKRRIPNEIRVLAKNQKGLKELFEIISNSLTDDYNNGPKFLSKTNQNIIIYFWIWIKPITFVR